MVCKIKPLKFTSSTTEQREQKVNNDNAVLTAG